MEYTYELATLEKVLLLSGYIVMITICIVIDIIIIITHCYWQELEQVIGRLVSEGMWIDHGLVTYPANGFTETLNNFKQCLMCRKWAKG